MLNEIEKELWLSFFTGAFLGTLDRRDWTPEDRAQECREMADAALGECLIKGIGVPAAN